MGTAVEKLLKQAQAGDRVALGRLLVAYDQRLRRYLSQRISANFRATVSVDDLLQDTYTEAYSHIDRFDYRGANSFYHWLAKIADHKLLDAVKSQRAAKRMPAGGVRRIGEDRSESLLGLVRLIDSKGKTPSKVVARREAVREMQVALASLPEDCRRAVWLRHIEGRPAREVAGLLGRTEHAVHQLCYRGLLRLREAMGTRGKFLSDSW
ncbi:MAG TPA: sigma-70 family RNA polymerase sigma factor [Phycisphaerae bacterium]|nr:sigma-70 family RNA polymerase sigma factor [Phycisphaerae bacterium]